jgi:hypothetical protein
MKEANYLLMHIIRALKDAKDKSLTHSKKSRVFFHGLDAIKALQAKISQDKGIISIIMDAGEYSEKDWQEIVEFIKPDTKKQLSQLLDKFVEELNINLHLELVMQYKASVTYVKELSKDLNNNIGKIQEEYDKLLKCVKSCKALLGIASFEKHMLFEDIQYAADKCIHSFSEFILLHPEIKFEVNEEMTSLLPDIAAQTIKFIEYISKLTREPIQKFDSAKRKSENDNAHLLEKYVDPRRTLEKIIENSNTIRTFFGKSLFQKIMSVTYDKLMELYVSLDDDDNIMRIRSKKELLDLSYIAE